MLLPSVCLSDLRVTRMGDYYIATHRRRRRDLLPIKITIEPIDQKNLWTISDDCTTIDRLGVGLGFDFRQPEDFQEIAHDLENQNLCWTSISGKLQTKEPIRVDRLLDKLRDFTGFLIAVAEIVDPD